MKYAFLGLAWLVGTGAGAFLLAPPIIILAFGIPFAHDMKRRGVLTSTAPVYRYIVSFVMLLGLFAILSFTIWHFFPEYVLGYVFGVVITVTPGLRKCGRNPDNIRDFFSMNARYLNEEVMKQYIEQHHEAMEIHSQDTK